MTVVNAPRGPTESMWELRDRDDKIVELRARRIGQGTSYAEGKPRWFEVDIYVLPDGTYAVHTQGRTTLAGEETRRRIVKTPSPYEVVELLTAHLCRDCEVRNHMCGDPAHRKTAYIPRQSARALAVAAQWDDGIRDAYVNRAVT